MRGIYKASALQLTTMHTLEQRPCFRAMMPRWSLNTQRECSALGGDAQIGTVVLCTWWSVSSLIGGHDSPTQSEIAAIACRLASRCSRVDVRWPWTTRHWACLSLRAFLQHPPTYSETKDMRKKLWGDQDRSAGGSSLALYAGWNQGAAGRARDGHRQQDAGPVRA